jgi:hypothetical protein
MSKRVGVKFTDFGQPPTCLISAEERDAIEEVLNEREDYVNALSPPDIAPPSVKGARTKERREIASDILTELEEIRDTIPRIGSVSTRRAKSKTKESLVVLLSDWHLGQRVADPETGDILYNTQIALDRITATPQLVADLFSQQEMSNFDETVLLMAGDMVSGEGIFDGHNIMLREHAVEQVNLLSRTAWQMIADFRSLTPLVRIVTARGNHGRALSPEANWDNMFYQILGILTDLRASGDITIKNRYGNFASVDIKGWRGIVRHYAPAQSETAAGAAKYAGWLEIHDWDFFCLGHWHHWGVNSLLGKPIFRNASLMGGDDYAETLAKHDTAAQLVWGVTEEKLPTFTRWVTY